MIIFSHHVEGLLKIVVQKPKIGSPYSANFSLLFSSAEKASAAYKKIKPLYYLLNTKTLKKESEGYVIGYSILKIEWGDLSQPSLQFALDAIGHVAGTPQSTVPIIEIQ